jgi:hypothetical protein
MSRRSKNKPFHLSAKPKPAPWAQSTSLPPIDHTVALREELQRMRIERAGFISEIEELKAEIARLKEEAENLRVAVAALPLPSGEMKS